MKNLLIYLVTTLLPFYTFAFDASIPVVDLNDYFDPERHEQFIETLSNACKEVGFFAVINTGVNIEILDSAYQAAYDYFHQDPLIKKKDHYPALNGQRGFVPGESAKGQSIGDFKEFYHVGRDKSSNVWPETGELQEPLTTLFHALERCKIPLEQAISEALGQPLSFFF